MLNLIGAVIAMILAYYVWRGLESDFGIGKKKGHRSHWDSPNY
jgi:hypothetical protein